MLRNSRSPVVPRPGPQKRFGTLVRHRGNERYKGVSAVDRATVVIVSDETEFSRAVTTRWQAERDLPSFLLTGSSSYRQLVGETFALAILGGLPPESLESALDVLKSSGKPAIHVSRLNGHSPKSPNIFSLPQVAEWPDLLIQLATQILARERAAADLA